MLLALLSLLACGSDPVPVSPPPPPPAVEAEPEPVAVVRGPTNKLPQVNSITFKPARPTVKDDIEVIAKASDPDQDVVDLDYVWIRNGERLLNRTDDRVRGSDFEKGDKIAVLVKASDAEGTTERESEPFLLENSAPRFTTDPSRAAAAIDGLRLEAEDPDHDVITFRLEGAPGGMTVDPKQGILHYKGSEDEKGGDYRVKVVADDGDGGFARWEFGISVTPGSKAAAEAKAAKAKAEADKQK